MRVGDLVWAPYRNRVMPGVIVGKGRTRYRVYLIGANVASWIGKPRVFLRDCDSKSPAEDRARALGGSSGTDDPRPLKVGNRSTRGRLGVF